ncbi:MAG TPA: c-type cytochrome biogenesis protein CcsB, partial [Marmoricola sp.]
MSHDQFEVLSNQAVAVCAVAYFLAVLAHLVEWAVARSVPATDHGAVDAGAALVEGSSAGMRDTGVLERTDVDEARVERFGRIGVVLTVVAAGVHLVAVVARGLAADPVRVPWGNMYEFTLTATLVVTAGYLALYRRYGLAWLSPIVTGFVLVTLMVDVLFLYDPVVALQDALDSPWLVIHVIAA